MTAKNNTYKIDTQLLEFDRGNPRLVEVEDLKDATDEKIMCALVEQADIGELIESIVANTYLDIEPLIVIKKGANLAGNYRVLEGNRRLAAIRFLQKPELGTKCKLSIPHDVSQDVIDSLIEVTVYEVEEEEESQAFIAFKHINGAHRWDAYAKARYITDWYIKDYDTGISIDDIASKVGDKNQYVRSILGGMLVLKQAENNELFAINDRKKRGKFGFSHFYTALGRLEYRKFLDLEKEWNQRPSLSPVKKEFLPNLKEILYYIYGSQKDDFESVIKSQNPDLKRLGTVIDHPVAISILRTTRSLDEAEVEVFPSEVVFQDALILASTKVQDAMKKVSKYSPEKSSGLIPMASEMSESASSILLLMKNRTKVRAK